MNFFLNESLNNLSCLLKNYIYTKIQFKIAKTKEILQVSVITLICSLLLLVSSVCLWGGGFADGHVNSIIYVHFYVI